MKIYVLDKLDLSFFDDYPITIAILEAGKHDVYLDTHLYEGKGEVVNTITDDETLRWINDQCMTELSKPQGKVEVRIKKNDLGVIILKRGNGIFQVYEVIVQ